MTEAQLIAYRQTLAETPPFVGVLLDAVQVHDIDTYKHLLQVGQLTERVALRLGLTSASAAKLGLAGLLHDVGKLEVSPMILRAPRSLSEAEWAIIREHPDHGAQRCRDAGEREIARIIRDHHERLDGSGYPQALRGGAISLAARLVAVVDVYDVLVRGRSYRGAVSTTHALRILYEAGEQFDHELISALEQTLSAESAMPRAAQR